MLKGQLIRSMGMLGKRANHIFNEIVHAPVGRSHLNLRIAGNLQDRKEKRLMFQQSPLHISLGPAIQPIAPATPHLAPQKTRRGLQFVLPFDDWVMGKSMLNKRGCFPSLAPTRPRIQDDVLGQLIDRSEVLIKSNRLVQIGSSIHSITLQRDVVGS